MTENKALARALTSATAKVDTDVGSNASAGTSASAIKYKSVIYNHPIWGRNICLERKWDSIEEELEDKQKTYLRENDPWNKLHMYMSMVLSRPKRSRLSLCDACGAFEYMDESAVTALPSAMDAVYSLMSKSVVLERIFALLGGLTPVPAADGRDGQWLRARRGFRAQVTLLMKLLDSK